MSCLLELHQRNISGVVFDAIMISLPAAPTPTEWLKMRQVTSRRLVNAYSWVPSLIDYTELPTLTRRTFLPYPFQLQRLGPGHHSAPAHPDLHQALVWGGGSASSQRWHGCGRHPDSREHRSLGYSQGSSRISTEDGQGARQDWHGDLVFFDR